MRLRSNLRVLERGRGQLQLGADPRWAMLLTDLTEPEREMLLRLRDPDRPSTSTLIDKAALRGVSADRLRALLALLDEAGLLVRTPRAGDGPRVPSALLDDAAAIETALPGTPGAQTFTDRRNAVVAVSGLGRLGMVVAGTLAAGGIGTLLLDDTRPVRPADVGVGGFRERDVGAPRARAAAEVMMRAYPSTRTGSGRADAPDVVVMVFEEAADPVRTARLMAEGVPHLAVTIREADVVVGPFVDPGQSPCLTCLDLHRTDQDSLWPELATQLRRAGRLAPAGLDTSLAALAGAMAAAHVLARVDGYRPATAGASIEMSIPDALPRMRSWEMHPGCGCIDVSPR
ncbi:ThiF family adenylyltransferase [Sanguibacter antarcticus]|uniref:Bacteriocin biosynthesis cyclodehydratase domain-containing protein n=1 Tax=Sanguibacter antarcticus TaxID=372484 RepID=A0A2A9E6I2_9MICO|nr:ThiF family adenylyltransferase [Sanguibacter antarcticus]PFG33852.1 bacteriocin biosynthesis cyclodehydratase domain-containing protein [Sanguibacter antarcticus]